MTLPLAPKAPPSNIDKKAVLASLTLMGIGTIPFAIAYGWLVDLSIIDISIPTVFRFVSLSLLIIAFGRIFRSANHFLITGISSWIFVLYVISATMLNIPIPEIMRMKFVIQTFVISLIGMFGYLIPFWFGYIDSGLLMLYAASVSGSCLGALESMRIIIDLLIRSQATRETTQWKYLAWVNFIWLLLVYTGIILASASIKTALMTERLPRRWFYRAMVFLVPFSLLFTYEAVKLIAPLNEEDILDYMSVFMGLTILMLAASAVMPMLKAAWQEEYAPLGNP